MKIASVNEIKHELAELPHSELLSICLRLAKYKKENKELLNYLLFEAQDEQAFINVVKTEINDEFDGINQSNLYYAKKSIRKILRITNKYIRYTASKETEIILLQHFCVVLKDAGIAIKKSTALINLYQAQIKKIKAAIATLHEDLQYDYLKVLKQLEGMK